MCDNNHIEPVANLPPDLKQKIREMIYVSKGPGSDQQKLDMQFAQCETYAQLRRFLKRNVKDMSTLALMAVQVALLDERRQSWQHGAPVAAVGSLEDCSQAGRSQRRRRTRPQSARQVCRPKTVQVTTRPRSARPPIRYITTSAPHRPRPQSAPLWHGRAQRAPFKLAETPRPPPATGPNPPRPDLGASLPRWLKTQIKMRPSTCLDPQLVTAPTPQPATTDRIDTSSRARSRPRNGVSDNILSAREKVVTSMRKTTTRPGAIHASTEPRCALLPTDLLQLHQALGHTADSFG